MGGVKHLCRTAGAIDRGLDRGGRAADTGVMSTAHLIAPNLADFDALARAALTGLPDPFRARLDRLVVRVEDFAPMRVLCDMGLSDPYELTGLYEGVALPDQSSADLPGPPPVVWLYRRPILDEWAARGDVELGRLITHVLVHEIAHHFGLSDAEIAAIDDWRL